MSADIENFAITLTDQSKTQYEWLSVMRFGLGTLLANPPLLLECIVRRASRMTDEKPAGLSKVPADFAVQCFNELGLRFELTKASNPQ